MTLLLSFSYYKQKAITKSHIVQCNNLLEYVPAQGLQLKKVCYNIF